MFRTTRSRMVLAGVVLVATVIGVCLAEDCTRVHVSINPHKIVLNAQGKADSVQANIPIGLPGTRIADFDVSLWFGDTEVAQAESARYCVIDDMLIIGFDRTTLQENPDVQAMANTTVIATVEGWVLDNSGTTTSFSGTDRVQIVKRGKKGRR